MQACRRPNARRMRYSPVQVGDDDQNLKKHCTCHLDISQLASLAMSMAVPSEERWDQREPRLRRLRSICTQCSVRHVVFMCHLSSLHWAPQARQLKGWERFDWQRAVSYERTVLTFAAGRETGMDPCRGCNPVQIEMEMKMRARWRWRAMGDVLDHRRCLLDTTRAPSSF